MLRLELWLHRRIEDTIAALFPAELRARQQECAAASNSERPSPKQEGAAAASSDSGPAAFVDMPMLVAQLQGAACAEGLQTCWVMSLKHRVCVARPMRHICRVMLHR